MSGRQISVSTNLISNEQENLCLDDSTQYKSYSGLSA